ncbi:MAG: RcpC/CpaB family pilus assembly protein, partial [Acetanaerobacterium sp.]
LSGKLLPGDVVSVYANLANNPNQFDYRSSLVSELYYIEVLAVTNEEIGDVEDYEATPDDPDVSTLPTTVTLRCINFEQARTLVGLEANSSIHLALLCRDDEDYKKELLDAQAQYFILLSLQQEQLSSGTSSQPGNDSSSGTSSDSSEEGGE